MQTIQSGLSEKMAIDEYKTPDTKPFKTFSSVLLSPNRSINKLYSASEKESFTQFLSFSPFKRLSIKRRFVGGIGRPALNQLFTVKTETPNSLAISAREKPFCAISFFKESFSLSADELISISTAAALPCGMPPFMLNQLFTEPTVTRNLSATHFRVFPVELSQSRNLFARSFFNSSFSFFIIYPLFYSCSATSKLPSSSNIRPWARQISPARAYMLPRQKLLIAISNSSREEKFFFNLSICSSVKRKIIFPDSSSSVDGDNKTFNAFSCTTFMARPENQLSTVRLLTPINSAKSCRDFPLSFSHALILSSNCVLMPSNYACQRNLSSLFYALPA